MRSRRRGQVPGVSLFSMLDILSSVIGVLSLTIAGTALASLFEAPQVIPIERGWSEKEQVPIFVECCANGLILHTKGVQVPDYEIGAPGGTFDALLEEIAASSQPDYVLFLVRPDGLETFAAARSVVEGRGMELGFEPLYDAWPIIFKEASEVLI